MYNLSFKRHNQIIVIGDFYTKEDADKFISAYRRIHKNAIPIIEKRW